MSTNKKPAKKASVKNPGKKVTVKNLSEKTVVVKPVTDSTGVVTMKSVDDSDTTTYSKGSSVKPSIDKETGVVTMVPFDSE